MFSPPDFVAGQNLLLVSALHSLWTKLTSPAVPDEPVDAEWKPAASELEKAPEKPAEGSLKSKDQELDRMIAMFNLLRASGG